MFLLYLLVLGLGLFLLKRGRWGRAIDDHPVCPACRFDLLGVPGAGVRGSSARCPECGARVGAPGAVRIGNRRPRPVLVWLGACLMTLSVASMVLTTWARHRGVELVHYLPLGMVIERARGGADGRSHDSREELIRRIAAGELDAPDLDRLAAVSLEEQARESAAPLSRTVSLGTRWGDVFEAVAASPRGVSAEDISRYLVSAVRYSLVPRAKVVVGDPVPFDVVAQWRGAVRGGAATSHSVFQALNLQVLEVSLAGQPLPVPVLGGTKSSSFVMTNWGPAMGQSLDQFGEAAVPPGPAELRVRLRATWDTRISPGPPLLPAGAANPLVREFELVETVEIVPAGSAAIEVTDSDAARTYIVERYCAGASRGFASALVSYCPGSVVAAPADYAFEVFLAIGEERIAAGHLVIARDWQGSGGYFSFGPEVSRRLRAADQSTLALVLRPSVEVAKRSVGVELLYAGEEIVLPLSPPSL